MFFDQKQFGEYEELSINHEIEQLNKLLAMNDGMREEMKRLNELLKDEELQRKELRKVQTRHTRESTSSQALDRVYNRGIDNQIPTDG